MLSRSHKVFLISTGAVFLIVAFNFLFLSAPKAFSEEKILSIEPGMSLRAVSLKLKDEGFIRSRIFFEAFVIVFAGERHAVSTDYFFEKKLPVYEVARRVALGKERARSDQAYHSGGFQ